MCDVHGTLYRIENFENGKTECVNLKFSCMSYHSFSTLQQAKETMQKSNSIKEV